jgi:hypothetical protein
VFIVVACASVCVITALLKQAYDRWVQEKKDDEQLNKLRDNPADNKTKLLDNETPL